MEEAPKVQIAAKWSSRFSDSSVVGDKQPKAKAADAKG
jgi:hypothetical protein